jgi:Domain of unknown function (DUF4382)
MRHAHPPRRAITASQKVFLSTLLLSSVLIGCDTNSCILIVSNPGGGGGTISGNGPNCSLNTTTAVSMRITSSLPPAEDSHTRIQHIFVTLRGIDANPSAAADENSPDWQELAPNLSKEPIQLDLLSRSADSCDANISARVSVPANAYRQLRLRLSSNQPDATDPLLQQNSCGSAAFNCVVTSDGNIKPLVFDRNLPEIQVPSAQIATGLFRILSDSPLNLKIEFNPQSSHFIPTDASEAVRLVPVFTADVQSPCESLSVADR